MTRGNVGLAGLVSTGSAALGWLCLQGARSGFSPDPPGLLTSLSLGTAGLMSCYLAVLAALVFLAGTPGHVSAWAHRLGLLVAPRLFPRLLAAVIVTGAALSPLPAYAAPPASGLSIMEPSGQRHEHLDPPLPTWGGEAVPLPQWDGAAAFVAAPAPDLPSGDIALVSGASRGEGQGQWVVRRGDTLWGMAARSLPADASPDRITTEVQRWYDANRDVIGDNPNLIYPGQVLLAPDQGDHR